MDFLLPDFKMSFIEKRALHSKQTSLFICQLLRKYSNSSIQDFFFFFRKNSNPYLIKAALDALKLTLGWIMAHI